MSMKKVVTITVELDGRHLSRQYVIPTEDREILTKGLEEMIATISEIKTKS